LDRLKSNPDSKIMDVLQMRVDGLQYEEKEIFLHIACFFKGERPGRLCKENILDACGLYSHIRIQRILEKSLIAIKDTYTNFSFNMFVFLVYFSKDEEGMFVSNFCGSMDVIEGISVFKLSISIFCQKKNNYVAMVF
jgi:hypothetical protein